MDPSLQQLLDACHSAELTLCGLIRAGREKSAPGWAINAFSVLRFKADPLPHGSQIQRYLTGRPEGAPDSAHQLFIARTDLLVPEAIQLCLFSGSFVDPHAP